MHTSVRRRSIVAGAAWAVPAVSMAASAPAVAASTPTISRSFKVARSANSTCGTLTVTTDNSTSYFRIINATSSTTVTSVTASMLVQVSGLSFTSNNAYWSNPVQDTVTYVVNGITYYRYYSTLLSAVPAPVNGTITLPLINWSTSCVSALSTSKFASGTLWVNGRGAATINGTQQVNLGSYLQV